jgi:hypothetical protein
MDHYEYELFGYQVVLAQTLNGKYKIGSISNPTFIGLSPGNIEEELEYYLVFLNFVKLKLRQLNA